MLARSLKALSCFALISSVALIGSCNFKVQKKSGAPADDGLEGVDLRSAPAFSFLYGRIIDNKCAGCHSADLKLGGYDFSSYSAVLGSGAVKPGDPQASLFYTSLLAGAPKPMPRGMAPLSEREIELIRIWIQEGAKEEGVIPEPDTGTGVDTGTDTSIDTDTGSDVDTGVDTGTNTGIDTGTDTGTGVETDPPTTLTVSYADKIKPIFDTRCLFCHNTGMPSKGVDVTSLETIAAKPGLLVPRDPGASKIYEILLPEAGDKRMPMGSPLTEDEISLVREWILQGAK